MEKFDQVIIDGPLVLGLVDVLLLGSLVEVMLLVVEVGSMSWDYVCNVMKCLFVMCSWLIGGILTKMGVRGSAYGYYNNYYYY